MFESRRHIIFKLTLTLWRLRSRLGGWNDAFKWDQKRTKLLVCDYVAWMYNSSEHLTGTCNSAAPCSLLIFTSMSSQACIIKKRPTFSGSCHCGVCRWGLRVRWVAGWSGCEWGLIWGACRRSSGCCVRAGWRSTSGRNTEQLADWLYLTWC